MEGVRVSTKWLFDERQRRELVVAAGQTVAQVIAGLQLDSDTGFAALVNGRLAGPERVLIAGDEVVLVEMISGGS